MKCLQTCHQCRDEKNRPRKWLWHCEDCVEEHEEKHLRETGHVVETTITREDMPKEKVFGMIADTGRLMGRRGW